MKGEVAPDWAIGAIYVPTAEWLIYPFPAFSSAEEEAAWKEAMTEQFETPPEPIFDNEMATNT